MRTNALPCPSLFLPSRKPHARYLSSRHPPQVNRSPSRAPLRTTLPVDLDPPDYTQYELGVLIPGAPHHSQYFASLPLPFQIITEHIRRPPPDYGAYERTRTLQVLPLLISRCPPNAMGAPFPLG